MQRLGSLGCEILLTMLAHKHDCTDIIRPASVQSNDFVTGLIAANRVGAMQGTVSIKDHLGQHGFVKLLYGSDEIRA